MKNMKYVLGITVAVWIVISLLNIGRTTVPPFIETHTIIVTLLAYIASYITLAKEK
mgnify:CR=1 FL=1